MTDDAPRPAWSDVPPDVLEQLQHGKLEQTCPACGRWQAASSRCSWCWRLMGPADLYPNRSDAERSARMPATAPANPPTELRQVYRPDKGGWPPQWGPNPYKAARAPGYPL